MAKKEERYKKLSLSNFYSVIAANSNISNKTAKRVWENITNFLINEMQYNDYVWLENFGKFEVVYRGGKDEWFTNEYGIPEKKYVSPIMSVEFAPSDNLLDKVNGDLLERLKRVQPTDLFFEYGKVMIEPDLEEGISNRIDLVLERKNKRRKSSIVREKKVKEKRKDPDFEPTYELIFKGKPIKCITINKPYPSIAKAAKDLGLTFANINSVLDKDKDYYGYKFISLTDEEYLEEVKKWKQMKENNESNGIKESVEETL